MGSINPQALDVVSEVPLKPDWGGSLTSNGHIKTSEEQLKLIEAVENKITDNTLRLGNCPS